MGGAPQDTAGGQASARPHEPLTRRRASSFCGAGRSTGERKIQDTEAAPLLCPGRASPCKVLPQQHPSALQNAGGVRTGAFPQRTSLQLAILGRRSLVLQAGAEKMLFFFFFFQFIYLFQLEANYFTILWWVLPYIDMNQPWVYMCSPS